MDISERGVEICEGPDTLESWLRDGIGKGAGAKVGRLGNSTKDGRFVGVGVFDALLLVVGRLSDCSGKSKGDGGRTSDISSVPVEGSPIFLVGTLSPSGSLADANSTKPPNNTAYWISYLKNRSRYLQTLFHDTLQRRTRWSI